MSVSQVMMMLKKQKEEQQAREQDRLERKKQNVQQMFQQNQAATNRLREQNRQIGAQVVKEPVGGAVYGLLSGLGEGIAQGAADIRTMALLQAQEYVQAQNQGIRELIHNENKNAMMGDWENQNKNLIGKILEKAMQMNPDQAKRAFEPLFADLENKIGDRYEVTDFNPSNGVLTVKQPNGELYQKSLLDDYPKLKQEKLYNQGMQESGFTDQDIIEQARKEEEQAQRMQQEHLNAALGHQRRMENLAREKFEYEKQKDKNMLQDDVFQGNKNLKELYMKDMQEGLKNQETWDEEIQKNKTEIEKSTSFLKMLDKLEELKNKAGQSTFLTNSTKWGQALRDAVAKGDPITTQFLKTVGVEEKDIEFVQDYAQEIKNTLAEFYSRYGTKYAGNGARSDRDMEQIEQNVVPLLFSPGEGFLNALKGYRDRTEDEIKGFIKTSKSYLSRKIKLVKHIKSPKEWLAQTGESL